MHVLEYTRSDQVQETKNFKTENKAALPQNMVTFGTHGLLPDAHREATHTVAGACARQNHRNSTLDHAPYSVGQLHTSIADRSIAATGFNSV